MKKNKLMEEIRQSIPVEVKEEIDFSFKVIDRIHYLLEKQHKSQRYLAAMLGKSESEISKWMRGTHNFTLTTIRKIEQVLGEKIIQISPSPIRKSSTGIDFQKVKAFPTSISLSKFLEKKSYSAANEPITNFVGEPKVNYLEQNQNIESLEIKDYVNWV